MTTEELLMEVVRMLRERETNLFGVYRLKDKAVAWQEYFETLAREEGLHWLQYSVTEAQVRE